jgi:trk system potassium uptake protein TrkH
VKKVLSEFRLISRNIGTLLMFLGLFLIPAIIVAISFEERPSMLAYIISFLIIEASGVAMFKSGVVGKDGALQRRTAIATVAFSWLAVGIFGAIPFILDLAIVNPVDAFFETVSGFTTTGSTILLDIEVLSKTSLFWRSLIQWIGGMGIIVLFIAIFPQMGVGAKHMFKSEVPGPITEGLKPKIRETSSMLWKIYFGFTASLMLLLWASGMTLYDAICHSLTTMSTGGFSTHNASIAYFDSFLIEFIIIIFMYFASINFSLYYAARSGKTSHFFTNTEVRVFTSIILIVTLLVFAATLKQNDYAVFESFRNALFQVMSIITTTGFGTDDYTLYPIFAQTILVLLISFGACAGSTAGGIKISRLIIMAKAIYLEVYKTFRPQYVKVVKLNGSAIQTDVIRSVIIFILLFVLTVLLGSILLTLLGTDMQTAFSATMTAVANVGPGLGSVGPVENFSSIPALGKIFLSLCMILGRLEFYTLLILLLPSFWKR